VFIENALAGRINSIYTPILNNKSIFKNRLIVIHYENFVSGDEAIKRLASFLQLPDLTNSPHAEYGGLKDFQRDTDIEYFSKYWEQDITKSRIGRYKEILTQGEIDIVKKSTKDLRDMFGYE
jgi:hypothetical protein